MNADHPDVQAKPFFHLASEVLESADRDELLRFARTFIRVEEIIDSVHNLKRLLERVMSESEKAVGAETSSLLLYDPDTHELYFEVALGPNAEQFNNIRLAVDETSIAGLVATRKAPVIIEDVTKEPRWNQSVDETTQFTTRNILAVPMLRQGRVIGVIEVLNKKNGEAFTIEDQNIMMILGSLSATAIENAQLYARNLQAERLAVLGTAVANISHYIKNVLTGLKGSIALVESAVQEEEYEILGRATQVMKRSYGRIHTLVRDMLSYSKGNDSSPEPMDPGQVLQDVHEMMVESANAKGIGLELCLGEEQPQVMADPEFLEGVLLNLVTNAMDALYEMGQGNPDFSGVIRLSTLCDGDDLSIQVSDNGPGIPDAEHAKIFTAFYTTKGSSGTGLGLAVSKKVVEEMGGELCLHSSPGKGATFEIRLPALVPA